MVLKDLSKTFLILATSSALLFTGLGGANAVSAQETAPASETARSLPSSDETQAAIDEAFVGNDSHLAALLEGPQSAQTQAALKQRLEARGDFTEAARQADESKASEVAAMGTGQYEMVCTYYNGQTMGWWDKEVLACHGYMDTYISGRQVAHYIPDLIPRGGPISYGCAYAAFGAIVSLTNPVGAIGWAVYGIGVLVAAGGVVISCG